MGTIAFHLILGIIMMITKLGAVNQMIETEIFIEDIAEIVEEIEKQEQEKIKEEIIEKEESIDKQVEDLLKSVVSNSDIKPNKDNTQSVQDMIKEIENNLDEYRSDETPAGKGKYSDYIQDSIALKKDKDALRKLDSLKTIEYSGQSSVYYSLKNRHKTRIPIPVFKCENAGKVTVQIIVNRLGRVVSATIKKEKASSNDENLHENAIDAAFRSQFNKDLNAPPKQMGTITFHFAKQ
jgi:TonB family protein